MKKTMRSLRNPNRRPTHPGAILREDILAELDITQAAFANHLGVSRLTVCKRLLIYGKLSKDLRVSLQSLP